MVSRRILLTIVVSIMMLGIMWGTSSCSDVQTSPQIPQDTDKEVNITSGLLIPYTLDKLIETSDAIVIGRVVEILPAEWGLSYKRTRDVIHTDVIVEVQDYLIGKVEYEYIAVRTWGGEVDDVIKFVEGQPEFTQGEEVILYLYELDVRDGEAPKEIAPQAVYGVVGSIQGKAEYRNEKVLHLEDVEEKEMSISELIEKIEKIRE